MIYVSIWCEVGNSVYFYEVNSTIKDVVWCCLWNHLNGNHSNLDHNNLFYYYDNNVWYCYSRPLNLVSNNDRYLNCLTYLFFIFLDSNQVINGIVHTFYSCSLYDIHVFSYRSVSLNDFRDSVGIGTVKDIYWVVNVQHYLLYIGRLWILYLITSFFFDCKGNLNFDDYVDSGSSIDQHLSKWIVKNIFWNLHFQYSRFIVLVFNTNSFYFDRFSDLVTSNVDIYIWFL